jgi:hypothetical protein
MRYLVTALFALAISMVAGAPAANAQTVADIKVSTLKPFTPEANFMSLPGYLRYLVHQQTGRWVTYAEAARAVGQQTGQ